MIKEHYVEGKTYAIFKVYEALKRRDFAEAAIRAAQSGLNENLREIEIIAKSLRRVFNDEEARHNHGR